MRILNTMTTTNYKVRRIIFFIVTFLIGVLLFNPSFAYGSQDITFKRGYYDTDLTTEIAPQISTNQSLSAEEIEELQNSYWDFSGTQGWSSPYNTVIPNIGEFQFIFTFGAFVPLDWWGFFNVYAHKSYVDIFYIDEFGQEISPSEFIWGITERDNDNLSTFLMYYPNLSIPEDTYSLTSKIIKGYTLKTVTGEESGSFLQERKTVTYIYQKKDSEYHVNFVSNGGSKTDAQTVNEYEKVKTPISPIREGYTFAGWYTDERLTILYDFNSLITQDLSLYAGWIKNREQNLLSTLLIL